MSAVDISPENDGGILKEVKRKGEEGPFAKPWKGDTVWVHYVGTLEDGTPFDSSRDRGDRFKFTLGKGEVIKGWDVGVATMTKGELSVFTIKSDYAYGDNGSPPKIPGGATLVFEVELFDFQGEDITKGTDGGVIKRIVESGEGLDHPNEDSQVEVELKGTWGPDQTVFEERNLTFSLGEGLEVDLPQGVELALEKMKKKEVCQVTIQPAYGFGSVGKPSLKVPAQAVLSYTINLKSFERAKESWQMDGEQKLEQAKLLKDKGTIFFKKEKHDLAGKKYKKIIDFLEHEISLKDTQEEERKALLQAGRLNLAMCYLKTGDWILARNICDKVLEENDESEKAFFRRGEAYLQLNDHHLAREDFKKVLSLDPNNKAASNKVAICMKAMKKQKEQEIKTYANMFEKFARIDSKKEADQKSRDKPMEINKWENAKNGGEGGLAGDPNTMQVTGDIKMDLDLNKEINNDQGT